MSLTKQVLIANEDSKLLPQVHTLNQVLSRILTIISHENNPRFFMFSHILRPLYPRRLNTFHPVLVIFLRKVYIFKVALNKCHEQ